MKVCLSSLAPLVLLLACDLSTVCAEQPVYTVANASSVAKDARSGRLFSAFNVIRFPNDGCTGSSNQNGTCYTAPECSAKGGKSAGSCAAGYGVCCIFTLGCGATSSQNCTYFTSVGSEVGECTATICPCNENICQLRLDFSSFSITGPTTASTTVTKIVNGQPTRAATAGVAVSLSGNCLTDIFSVTNPGGNTPPSICGSNTGQHMYVDTSDDCNDLSFQLASAASAFGPTVGTRQWNIKVTQYSCDFDNLAPQGCTQYFYGSNSQTVSSFNWDGGIHLANQDQNICVRICWSATNAIDFDLTGPLAAMGLSVDAMCCQYGVDGVANVNGYDCLIIPNALAATSKINPGSRFCGRMAGIKARTVCTNQLPFSVRFLSDMYEFTATESTAIAANLNKGLKLAFIQQASPCTTTQLAAAGKIAPDGTTATGR